MSTATSPTTQDDHLVGLAREVGVPVAIGLVVGTAISVAVGFLLINAPGRSITDFDVEVAERLVAGRTSFVTAVTGLATVLANSAFVVPVWAGSIAVAYWRTHSWRISAFLLAAVGGEKLTYLFTSIIVGRPRPDVESIGHVYASNSFPSGHIGSAISLYGAIAVAVLWHARRRGSPLPPVVHLVAAVAVAGVSALVGFSRMYRGHHFLSDIVWGTVLGVVWLWGAYRVALEGRDAATG